MMTRYNLAQVARVSRGDIDTIAAVESRPNGVLRSKTTYLTILQTLNQLPR